MQDHPNRQPVRVYRHAKKGNSSTRLISVIVMLLIVVFGVIVFIMSITGTGLYKENGANIDPSDTQKSDSLGTGDTEDTAKADPEKTTVGGITYRYLDKKYDDIHSGDLILLDADHAYQTAEPSLAELGGFDGRSYALSYWTLQLKPSAAEKLTTMLSRFKQETGYKTVMVSDAYRSIEAQKKLYEGNPTSAAKPGCSDYHTGTTCYISSTAGNFASAKESLWLRDHMKEYGFISRYPSEKKTLTGYDNPWQIRYVGIPHATYMANSGICLEEYLTYLQQNTAFSGTHLNVTDDAGISYEIFYVSVAEGSTIKLPVPDTLSYTVSGDNIGGLIVTITKGQ